MGIRFPSMLKGVPGVAGGDELNGLMTGERETGLAAIDGVAWTGNEDLMGTGGDRGFNMDGMGHQTGVHGDRLRR